MKIRTSKIGAVLAALSTLAISSAAMASSHREAPAIADDPAADNTDTYAFVDSAGQNLVVVANYIGLELPEGGPNWAKFSDDVLYEIHIARGANSLDDALTYQFNFHTVKPKYQDPSKIVPAPANGAEFFAQLTNSGAFNQTYTVTELTNGKKPKVLAQDIKVAPPNVGPLTTQVIYNGGNAGGSYENIFVDNQQTTVVQQLGPNQGRVFAGPRDDPFFVDLGGVFDLAQLRPVLNASDPGRDSIQYLNVHSIVLEIPLATANGGKAPVAGAHAAQTVGVWASASRQKTTVLRRDSDADHSGPWVQVSRLGLPLINEAVIGLQDKDYWNKLTPNDDATYFASYFDNPIVVRDAEFKGYYGAGGPLAACATNGKGPESGRLADIVPVINLPDHTGSEAIKSIGDVLRVDLGQTSGFPNGRLLTDDVVDVELGLLLCQLKTTIPDGPSANEVAFRTTFPYLAPPWEGFSSTPRPMPQ